MDRVHYVDPDTGTEYEWHGGAYIQIGYTATEPTGPFNDKGDPSHDAGDFVAHEVINVWDYLNDVPRIERTYEAFIARVREYIEREDEA